jgi:hypothetical protein
MSRRQITNFIGSPPWYVFQGLFYGWIGTAGASDHTRSWLFCVGLGMILLMLPLEIWWHRRQRLAKNSPAESGAA